MDLSLLETAGIPQDHFARLVGVNRLTVRYWHNGSRQPRPLYRDAAESMLRRIEKAHVAGALPLPAETKRGDRYDTLVNTLANF